MWWPFRNNRDVMVPSALVAMLDGGPNVVPPRARVSGTTSRSGAVQLGSRKDSVQQQSATSRKQHKKPH